LKLGGLIMATSPISKNNLLQLTAGLGCFHSTVLTNLSVSFHLNRTQTSCLTFPSASSADVLPEPSGSALLKIDPTMQPTLTLKTILFLSGFIGVVVGAAILFYPVPFYATSRIELGGNISLLNEIRASGGSLLATGILVMLGVFVEKLTYTALVVSTLTYLSYGLSRLLSMTVDGLPTKDLIVVAGLEIVIGLIGVFAWVKYRKAQSSSRSTNT
jgi:hypothetical protein